MPDFKVVFVELNRLPDYTISNISYLKDTFQGIQIVLITNVDSGKNFEKAKEVCEVHLTNLVPENQLLQLTRFKNSKDSFWIYTIQRLFELCYFHFNHPKSQLLHVESDVLLLQDFPLEKLSQIKTLMWGNYNLDHDVASLIYLPTIELTETFLLLMRKHLGEDNNHSDMTLLSAIANDPEIQHKYFASIPMFRSSMVNSRSTWPDCFVEKQSSTFPIFKGVFDHQIHGMYLDGLDPRLTYGTRRNLFYSTVLTGESFIDPGKLVYEVGEGLTLSINDQGETFPLFTLHVHSKNLEFFRANRPQILKIVRETNLKLVKSKFDLRVFMSLIFSNLRKKTFRSWFRHLIIALLKRS
jgi:hypothetical protein